MNVSQMPIFAVALRRLAAVFAVLFFISGADGQEMVQLSFLLFSALFLLVSAHWNAITDLAMRWLEMHPQRLREVQLLHQVSRLGL